MTGGWPDLIVLGGLAAVVAGSGRRLLAVFAVLSFAASFPPLSWPMWWCCLAPLVWIWRSPAISLSAPHIVLEAVAIGFSMGWLSTAFVRAGVPAWGWMPHALACLLYSVPVIALAIAIRWTRDRSIPTAAAVVALTAIGGELFQAACGVTWSVTNFALTVAATPLAQWSRWIGPFGVSGLLFLVNFLLVTDNPAQGLREWIGPTVALSLLAGTWCAGSAIADHASVETLPFSVLLVQPNVRPPDERHRRSWPILDRLTRGALRRDDGADLIVWPETCLSVSWKNASDSEPSVAFEECLTVQDFAHLLTPTYETTSLVGAVIAEPATTVRYGLGVTEVRHYNCGCLVSTDGTLEYHEKLALVPLREMLPQSLDFAWIRNHVLPALQLNPGLTPGRGYRPLSFRDRHGQRRTIAVSICYESLFPWLPQYRESSDVDAIVHLVNDGHSAEHPGMMQRHVRACQLRAIETRKWNLVCSTWSGSSLIDPLGRIVKKLDADPGTLSNTSLISMEDR